MASDCRLRQIRIRALRVYRTVEHLSAVDKYCWNLTALDLFGGFAIGLLERSFHGHCRHMELRADGSRRGALRITGGTAVCRYERGIMAPEFITWQSCSFWLPLSRFWRVLRHFPRTFI